MKNLPMPANGDMPCACCRRFHRKLFIVDGYWMGSTCVDHYTFYMRNNNITSVYWRGYEKQHAKVKAMLTGKAA
jgi:hypothetical protein